MRRYRSQLNEHEMKSDLEKKEVQRSSRSMDDASGVSDHSDETKRAMVGD